MSDLPGWEHQYITVASPAYLRFIYREQTASSISQYSSLVIPGLLQTPEYAAAVLAVCAPANQEELLELRLRRQKILSSPACPKIRVVLDESVLRRGDPAILFPQLAHLRQVMATAPVSVRVMPPGLLAVDSPFMVIDDDYVYAETGDGGTDSCDVSRFRWLFGERWEMASPIGGGASEEG